MIAVKRPITVFMISIAVGLLGWQAFNRLEISLLPDIQYPEFVIFTKYPGAGPEVIEKVITAPLEETLAALPGLNDIESFSRDGTSIIVTRFDWNIDHRFIFLRIREKVDALYERLPRAVQRPYIMDFNPAKLPVMELVLSGNMDLVELGEFAEKVIKPRFSQLKGIAGATIVGLPRQAVYVEMNPLKCARLGVSADDIITAVQDNLKLTPVASMIKVGYNEYPAIVDFSLENPEKLMAVPIPNDHNIPLRLGEIARIREKPIEQHSLIFDDSQPALLVLLYKESGASAVMATDAAIKLIDELKDIYPGVELTVLKNQGRVVRQTIDNLKQALLVGALLAFLVVQLFLQDWRYSLILTSVVPVSLLGTFAILFLHKITLNVMTVGGLALGVGLIVDNGIVTLESIFREMNNENTLKAIAQGTRKVAKAILGSTLTTVAIFLPLVYVRGYAEAIFQDEAIAITYTLLFSLVAAVFLVPALTRFSVFKTRRNTITASRNSFRERFISLAPIYQGFQKFYNRVEDKYHQLLLVILENKKSSLVLLLACFFLAALGLWLIPKSYWPELPTRRLELVLAVSDKVPFSQLETQVRVSIANLRSLPQVERVVSRVTSPNDIYNGSFQYLAAHPGYYNIRFSLWLKNAVWLNKLDRAEIVNQLTLPSENLSISAPEVLPRVITGTSSKNFLVYLSGQDRDMVKKAATELKNYLRTFNYCREVAMENDAERKVQVLHLRPLALEQNDLDPQKLGQDISLYTQGRTIGTWRKELGELPVIAVWDSTQVPSTEKLKRALIEPGRSLVRGTSLFYAENAIRVAEIKRVNRHKVITVSADVPAYKVKGLSQKVRLWFQNREYAGVTMEIAGESRRIIESFRELTLAGLMAAIMVYLILAASFESFIHPFNILLTIPIGIAGAVLSLVLFGETLNVISMIGIIMLIGIGVNDAIIKVDYAQYLTHRLRLPLRQAILRTSSEKFRPVLMTTLTTVVAMLPMAFGLGATAGLSRSLAVVIVGGLTITTIVTLLITPLLYELGEQLRNNKFHQGKNLN